MGVNSGGPAHVRLRDLQPTDGLPTEAYKNSVAALTQSLTRYNCAIVQLPDEDETLLRYSLDSSRVYFQHKCRTSELDTVTGDDSSPWSRTTGYTESLAMGRETYDFRPGTNPSAMEDTIPPSCLPEVFGLMGNAARTILEAIGRSLDVRTFAFTDLLDNVPLKPGEISSSVLSSVCHGRNQGQSSVAVGLQDDGQAMADGKQLLEGIEDTDPKAEKGLLALVRADRPGLFVRDHSGRWLLADEDLGPQDVIILTGLTLYQATGGYVSPSLFKNDLNSALVTANAPLAPHLLNGRVSMEYRLMPRTTAILHCSAMAAAGHPVAAPFQPPVAVMDFLQRAHPLDQIVSTTYGGSRPVYGGDGVGKLGRKRKSIKTEDGKTVPPSKKLRLEAQRVLKEKVQDLADAKGIKIHFCNYKDCEELHMMMVEDPPCSFQRQQLNWPANVPFVHPHDLNNKAKQAFLEAYEPGWTEREGGAASLFEVGPTPKRGAIPPLVPPDELKFQLKVVYDFLRASNKAVPTGKPQVVGHKVDLSLLCKQVYEAGGRERFEMAGGFQRFIMEQFDLEQASDKEQERALERLKKLFDQVLNDYCHHLLLSSHLE